MVHVESQLSVNGLLKIYVGRQIIMTAVIFKRGYTELCLDAKLQRCNPDILYVHE